MRSMARAGVLGHASTAAVYTRFGPRQPRLLSSLHTCPPLPAPSQPSLSGTFSRQNNKISSARRRHWPRTLAPSSQPSLVSSPAAYYSSSSPPPPSGGLPVAFKAILAAGVLGIAAYYAWTALPSWTGGTDASREDSREALNDRNFVPFEIVAREDVSPNAFVLTLRLAATTATEPSAAARRLTQQRIRAARQHGLWSVEVKQPQLQIARDYTPLPEVDGTVAALSSLSSSAGGEDDTDMRLFVRVVPGGEVSKFLSRRPEGSRIELRGPRRSFDVVARLVGGGKENKQDGRSEDKKAEATKMLVLAGGTGVATALQAADAALRASPTVSVSVLWANRQPYDGMGLSAAPNTPAAELNPIVRDIRALQAKYGVDRLQVQSFVDAEQTRISEAGVRRAMEREKTSASSPWYRFWGRKTAPETDSNVLPVSGVSQEAEKSCIYHSGRLLERQDADPLRSPDDAETACACSRGKNLVLVSGPDGFIEAWAGAKRWVAGKERQGPLGGILGQMAARDPQTFSQWQVLKL